MFYRVWEALILLIKVLAASYSFACILQGSGTLNFIIHTVLWKH